MGVLRDLFEWCSREISQHAAADELAGIIERQPSIRAYANAVSVVDTLAMIDSAQAVTSLNRKDEILRVILEEFQAGRNRRLLSSVLILSFAGRLARLGQRYAPAEDEAEGASQVIAAFLDVIASYPLFRRSTKIAANIAYETQKRLVEALEHERRRTAMHQQLADTVPYLELDGIGPGLDWSAQMGQQRSSQENPDDLLDALAVLDRLQAAGTIDAVSRELIEATQVYGWKLRDCINAGLWTTTGMSYRAAQKRIQRAYKRIRNSVDMDDPSLRASLYSKILLKK